MYTRPIFAIFLVADKPASAILENNVTCRKKGNIEWPCNSWDVWYFKFKIQCTLIVIDQWSSNYWPLKDLIKSENIILLFVNCAWTALKNLAQWTPCYFASGIFLLFSKPIKINPVMKCSRVTSSFCGLSQLVEWAFNGLQLWCT